MKKVKVAFLVVSVFLLCAREVYISRNVDISIEEPSGGKSVIQMSRQEARELDSFFREILIPDALAYTLVGVKPLSFACYRQNDSRFWGANRRISRGWEVWEKYKHLLENDRILFWKEESPWVKDVTCLVMADRRRCAQIIEQNNDFQRILGSQVADLFGEVSKTRFFGETMQMHDALIGILLGFGKRNAWLYHRNNHSSTPVKLPRIWNRLIEKESSSYEWKYLVLQSIDITDLALPRFVGDPDSEESQCLMNEYLTARKKIQNYYKDKDFLSATLSLYKHGGV